MNASLNSVLLSAWFEYFFFILFYQTSVFFSICPALVINVFKIWGLLLEGVKKVLHCVIQECPVTAFDRILIKPFTLVQNV